MHGRSKAEIEQQYYPGLADACRRAYHRSIDAIRDAASECGYAIGEHGSRARDIDLIAVPWTIDAVSAEEVADAILRAIKRTSKSSFAVVNPGPRPGEKPHGRLCWSIHVGGGPYFDLSVMPRSP